MGKKPAARGVPKQVRQRGSCSIFASETPVVFKDDLGSARWRYGTCQGHSIVGRKTRKPNEPDFMPSFPLFDWFHILYASPSHFMKALSRTDEKDRSKESALQPDSRMAKHFNHWIELGSHFRRDGRMPMSVQYGNPVKEEKYGQHRNRKCKNRHPSFLCDGKSQATGLGTICHTFHTANTLRTLHDFFYRYSD